MMSCSRWRDMRPRRALEKAAWNKLNARSMSLVEMFQANHRKTTAFMFAVGYLALLLLASHLRIADRQASWSLTADDNLIARAMALILSISDDRSPGSSLRDVANTLILSTTFASPAGMTLSSLCRCSPKSHDCNFKQDIACTHVKPKNSAFTVFSAMRHQHCIVFKHWSMMSSGESLS